MTLHEIEGDKRIADMKDRFFNTSFFIYLSGSRIMIKAWCPVCVTLCFHFFKNFIGLTK